MTRMKSKQQLDYFRTPDPEVRAIAHLLRLPVQTSGLVRVLDPCAGEARALALLIEELKLLNGVQHPQVDCYGVELHYVRAQKAAKELGEQRVLRTSYLKAYLSPGAFQLIFLNPPYDFDTGSTRRNGKRDRLENTFLHRATEHAAPEAVVIWVVPQARLLDEAEFWASYYQDICCFRFSDEVWAPPEEKNRQPTPIYTQFKQVALFGRRRPAPIPPNPELVAKILAWGEAGAALPILPRPGEALPEQTYAVPLATSYQRLLFAARAFDAKAVARQVNEGQGVFAERWYREEHWPEPQETQAGLAHIQPLVPLRMGMLIWLLVAGLFNGVVIEGPDGHPLLLKGVSTKEVLTDTTVIQADDGSREEIHNFTDAFVSEVWIRDLETGELILVK